MANNLDNMSPHSMMITPKLTVLMMAISLLGAGGPIAAMAQATANNTATQVVRVETGGNEQDNAALVAQSAENELEISSEAESEAQSEADAETSVVGSTIVANNAQNATVDQLNFLDDRDYVTVNAAQAALRTAIAADIDIENATAIDTGDMLELLGLDVDGPVLS
jgi:hypothetical protein